MSFSTIQIVISLALMAHGLGRVRGGRIPNKVGALFVDILALAAILWLRWPPGLFGAMG